MPEPTQPMIELDWLSVSLLMLPVAVLIGASVMLRMGMSGRIALAVVRSLCQLLLVGLVIGWVFQQRQWYWVIGLLVLMTAIAAFTARRQAAVKAKGLLGLLAIVLAMITTLMLLFMTQAVIGLNSWDPRYLVPLGGMLLGNAMTAATLAVERLAADLKRDGGDIEALLSMGASPAQAVKPLMRSAVRAALTPTLNAMLIVGIVKLPGMMTGQMLGGSKPMQAAMYQFMILIGILFTDAGAATLMIQLLYRRLFTDAWQLDRVKLREA